MAALLAHSSSGMLCRLLRCQLSNPGGTTARNPCTSDKTVQSLYLCTTGREAASSRSGFQRRPSEPQSCGGRRASWRWGFWRLSGWTATSPAQAALIPLGCALLPPPSKTVHCQCAAAVPVPQHRARSRSAQPECACSPGAQPECVRSQGTQLVPLPSCLQHLAGRLFYPCAPGHSARAGAPWFPGYTYAKGAAGWAATRLGQCWHQTTQWVSRLIMYTSLARLG